MNKLLLVIGYGLLSIDKIPSIPLKTKDGIDMKPPIEEIKIYQDKDNPEKMIFFCCKEILKEYPKNPIYFSSSQEERFIIVLEEQKNKYNEYKKELLDLIDNEIKFLKIDYLDENENQIDAYRQYFEELKNFIINNNFISGKIEVCIYDNDF